MNHKRTHNGIAVLLLLGLLLAGCGASERDAYLSDIAPDGTLTYSLYWPEGIAGSTQPADTPAWYVRWDILRQAGYQELPKGTDWETFREMAETVYHVTGYTLCAVQGGSPDFLLILLCSRGGTLWDEAGQPWFSGNDGLAEAVWQLSEMEEGSVIRVTGPDYSADYGEALRNGRAAGTVADVRAVAEIENMTSQTSLWTVLPVPGEWDAEQSAQLKKMTEAAASDDAFSAALDYVLEHPAKERGELETIFAVAQMIADGSSEAAE